MLSAFPSIFLEKEYFRYAAKGTIRAVLPVTKKKKKNPQFKKGTFGEGAKMAEEQDRETTFSPTNSSKEQFNAEQISQNNF